MDDLEEVVDELDLSYQKECTQEMGEWRTGFCKRGNSVNKGLGIEANMFGDRVRRLPSWS